MDIYNLSKVDSTIDGVIGPLRYGFNIVGVHSRPLVSFSFETQEEADAAHKAMQPIIAMAKAIVSHPPPYPR
jgi:transposase